MISNEGALLRFMDRFLMGEPIDKLLFEVATQLVNLFENILKKVSEEINYQKGSNLIMLECICLFLNFISLKVSVTV